jgi:plastocyanin
VSRLAPFLLAAASATLAATPALAGRVAINVRDRNGDPMANVVLSAYPTSGKPPALAAVDAVITQRDLQFSPYVVPVPVGSRVRFPNLDRIEHHVKSFSPVREFEIKVYKEGTPDPVTFEKPGVVPIHCLLHDWMRAYVFVVDTPWYTQVDANGLASMELPDGTYEIVAWHPDLGSIRPVLRQKVTVGKAAALLSYRFEFVPRKQRTPKVATPPSGSTAPNYGG